MSKACITGGRDFIPDPDSIIALAAEIYDRGITHLGHGAYGSVDWGVSMSLKVLVPHLIVIPFPVDHKLDGPWPAAGPRRNLRMLVTVKPDHLFAFKGNKGTASCKRHARNLGDITLWQWEVWKQQNLWRPQP